MASEFRSFELRGRPVIERTVEPGVVEPAGPLDDRELELAAGAPDAVGDRVVMKSNSGHLDVRNGERGVVEALDLHGPTPP